MSLNPFYVREVFLRAFATSESSARHGLNPFYVREVFLPRTAAVQLSTQRSLNPFYVREVFLQLRLKNAYLASTCMMA